MQTIEEILKSIKEKNLNISEISRKTGIPGTRIYKWLDNKGKPKVDDSEKIKEWAKNNLDKVPHETNSKEVIPTNGKDEFLVKYLHMLEDDKKYFQDLVKTNLSMLAIAQQVSRAHAQTLLHNEAYKAANGDKKKFDRELARLNKIVASYIPADSGMDISILKGN